MFATILSDDFRLAENLEIAELASVSETNIACWFSHARQHHHRTMSCTFRSFEKRLRKCSVGRKGVLKREMRKGIILFNP